MASIEGGFVWYELVTRDGAAAQAFYAKVIGWTVSDSGMPGLRYLLAKVGERQVAGLMDFPPGMEDPRPGWLGYILAQDVDAMAARVRGAGGSVHREPTDIPGVGRFAACSDPQGAAFMLFRGDGDAPPDLAPATPGAFGWHELHARDWEKAFAFYSGLFGWEKASAVDMGAMGTYQTFSAGGTWAGGMMSNAQAPRPFWLYYINVEDIDAATARVTEAGGKVQNGPMQVPGGSWIVQALDPQGAMFALVGPRR